MKKYHLILIFILFSNLSFTQEWEVPGNRIEVNSPFGFSDDNRVNGERIFNSNCLSCHGNPGQANYQALDPIPGDPAGEKIQNNTDGALQYKISEGRGLMPSFNNILSTDDIWQVIAYIRSFNNSYQQLVSLTQKLTDLKWSSIRILLILDKNGGNILASVTGNESGTWTPVPFTGVSLSAKRYFGMLALDDTKQTDEEGHVLFSYPDNLPGDESGNILVTAMLDDRDLFGTIRKDTVLKIGQASSAPGLTENRALWNSNRKAPVWLQISYPVVVIGIWGFIFLVLFLLRKIYKDGENDFSMD
jgi:hypothetical protein